MNEYESPEKEFSGFCFKVIKHSMIDYCRANHTYRTKSVAASYINDVKEDDIAYDGGIEIRHYITISALHRSVALYSETLAEALNKLPGTLCDIVLMYYFMELTDENIGSYFGVTRQLIWKKRQTALKRLCHILQGGQNE